MKITKIYIGSDHAGYQAKEEIKRILSEKNLEFEDVGTFSEESVDYPDYAEKVCNSVIKNENNFGILICGSGTGMQIAANKINGIRAAFCYDIYSATMARKDNNANVITLRGREFDHSKYKEILNAFFETEFTNFERHIRRINKLEEIEKKQCEKK
jgi:ribose 5-phosphate isomerase B